MSRYLNDDPCVSAPQGSTPQTREQVLIARKAFADGIYTYAGFTREHAEQQAAKKYPLPKKLVPREVVTSNGTKYRLNDGVVEWKPEGGFHWRTTRYVPEDYALIAGLKDNPTCEVEA